LEVAVVQEEMVVLRMLFPLKSMTSYAAILKL
jgi:hypothetical protein